MESPLLATAPSHHALRGFSAVMAGGTLLATLLRNRRALLSLKPQQLAALRLANPSRNAFAIAVFVGVFRYIERRQRQQNVDSDKEKPPSESTKKALVAASVICALCFKPSSRTPLVALLATNAVSSWWDAFIAKHPEISALKPLDLAVFMACSGWITYSGFFHPDSYEPAHMKLIMKYSITSQETAEFLRERYNAGLNPHPCDARHPGRKCGEFFINSFVWQVINMGLRVYAPVHATTWLLALRHRAVRERPLWLHLQQLTTRVVRSAMYYIVYIIMGWTLLCSSRPLGARSLAWRKFQYLVCGSLPALAILFESSTRRRPIAVILSSYAFVSMGSVIAQKKRFQWLQQSSSPMRTALDVIVATISVAYTLESIVDSSVVLQRMLYGKTTRTDRKTVPTSDGSSPAKSSPPALQ